MWSRLHGEEQMKANVLEDPSPVKFAETESVPVYSRHHQRKMLAQQASQAVTQIFDTPEVWNGAMA